jgi:hypothetical protein
VLVQSVAAQLALGIVLFFLLAVVIESTEATVFAHHGFALFSICWSGS